MLEALRSRWVGGRAATAALHLPATQLVDLVCPEGLTPASARLAWAKRVLAHYHGETASSWPLLDWPSLGARIVTAWRGGDAVQAQRESQAAGYGLISVSPRWPLLLQALLRSRPALRRAQSGRALLLETGTDGTAVLTQATLRHGRLQALHRRRLDAPWPGSLLTLHHGEISGPLVAAWVQGANGPAHVGTLTAAGLDAQAQGDVPDPADKPWRQDFLRPLPRPTFMAWAALAGGAVVLVGAAWGTHQAWQQRTAALAVATPMPSRMAPRPAPADALPAAVMGRLNHPWREVFLAAERPAVLGLNWLVLEHQAGAALHLQGIARSPDAVQRAAVSLRTLPPWRQVLIARLDVEGDQQLFELTAQGPSLTP